jgi:signal transduction histidine kinase
MGEENNIKIKHFKTNVLLKSIIGKDLINDDNIAILELVKNSFDANSKEVNVVFKNLKSNDDLDNPFYSEKSSKIIIQDFGIGMDETDLEEKWLNIAFSEKKTKKIEFNRVLAGAKGVGRFSCDRLGEYLDIYTRKKDGDVLHLFVNWKSFEIENRQDLEIQKIKIEQKTILAKEFKKITGFDVFEKGTILKISKLRSSWVNQEKNSRGEKIWNTNRILDLKKGLEKLINPNQSFNKTSFSIRLFAEDFKEEDKKLPDFKKINSEIKNKIFEKLEYTSTCITSLIDDTGKIITTTITDKGRDIFILQEKNTLFPILKNINIVLYYLNTYSKIYFAKQTGIRSVEFGSVYLFINGFRIPPYGDFGDDWLGLETRKGQGYARFLGTRELIGRIEIKDNLNQFQIVSSREGVVKDKNYNQLTESKNGFFYYTLKRLEKYVVDGLDWDRLTKKTKKEPEHRIEDENENPNFKNYISEFEKKVNSKNWKFSPDDEKYFENQQTKNRRILSIIDNIIDVKSDNIIDLYINEELIVELVKEEKEKAQEAFQKIISDIPELSEEQISALVGKIKTSREELESSLNKIENFPNVKINKDTSAAFKSSQKILSSSERDSDKNESLINKLLQQKEEAERKEKIEQDARLKAEEEKRILEEQLEDEKKKNTFLLATSKNLDREALGLYHHIHHETPKIDGEVNILIAKINNDEIKKKEILNSLFKIKLYTNKISTIGKLITRSNFNEKVKKQKLNLAEYISQYMNAYNEINSNSELSITVKNNAKLFETKVSAIEIAIVFDNLIHNSFKANSKRVIIEIKNIKDRLIVLFSDDGKGLLKRFKDNPESIFELGITSTDGSGIGLYTVRDLLTKMKGSIEYVGDGNILKGATFKITFTKDA